MLIVPFFFGQRFPAYLINKVPAVHVALVLPPRWSPRGSNPRP
jgi:hypothetical protein